MKLIFPAGQTHFYDSTGKLYMPDANGLLDIANAQAAPFLAAGFLAPTQTAATTASRPKTGLSAGLQYFDTTLGKPVWRNAANSGWVDATGTAA